MVTMLPRVMVVAVTPGPDPGAPLGQSLPPGPASGEDEPTTGPVATWPDEPELAPPPCRVVPPAVEPPAVPPATVRPVTPRPPVPLAMVPELPVPLVPAPVPAPEPVPVPVPAPLPAPELELLRAAN